MENEHISMKLHIIKMIATLPHSRQLHLLTISACNVLAALNITSRHQNKMWNEATFQFTKCNEHSEINVPFYILHINAIRVSVDILRNNVIKYDFFFFTAKCEGIFTTNVPAGEKNRLNPFSMEILFFLLGLDQFPAQSIQITIFRVFFLLDS